MAAAESHLRFGDYLELLKVFGERDAEALVVGGQAVLSVEQLTALTVAGGSGGSAGLVFIAQG